MAAEEVVRGPAVRSKADEARRALHAARRRRPPEPAPPSTTSTTPPVPVVAEEPARPAPTDDAARRALVEENRALRAEVGALRARLARIHDQSRPPADDV